jgi:hypothetical protein
MTLSIGSYPTTAAAATYEVGASTEAPATASLSGTSRATDIVVLSQDAQVVALKQGGASVSLIASSLGMSTKDVDSVLDIATTSTSSTSGSVGGSHSGGGHASSAARGTESSQSSGASAHAATPATAGPPAPSSPSAATAATAPPAGLTTLSR